MKLIPRWTSNRARLRFEAFSARPPYAKPCKRSSTEERERVAADPIGNDNPIEEILLTGFPNPERKGCPPAEVIEALGNQKLGRDDPAWGHIWSCSPCFGDFKVIRDARVERAERAYRKERTRRRFLVAAAATVLLVIAGFFLVTGTRSGVARGFASIYRTPALFVALSRMKICRSPSFLGNWMKFT